MLTSKQRSEFRAQANSLETTLIEGKDGVTENVPDGERQAQFVCVIPMMTPAGKTIQARGEIHGELLREPRGKNGFGYDPIFYYPPLGKSTAELSSEEKNQISHRANALKVFYEKLKEAGYADK